MMKVKGYENVRGANFCQLKPLDVVQLSWDMAQLTHANAMVLIKTLQPFGPLKQKYQELVEDVPTKPKWISKYFFS